MTPDDKLAAILAAVQVDPGGRGLARDPADNLFTVRARHGGLSLVELRPHTGRQHQLRVQLASRGAPIYGDAKYGGRGNLGPAIGLHARALTFLHPTSKAPTTVTAEVPKGWRGRFAHILAEGG